jgi:hypothetical protein
MIIAKGEERFGNYAAGSSGKVMELFLIIFILTLIIVGMPVLSSFCVAHSLETGPSQKFYWALLRRTHQPSQHLRAGVKRKSNRQM